MKSRIAPILILMCFLLCSPVQAKELEGNDVIPATGQTAVTAQIESAENSDGTSEVETGDDNKIITYVSLFAMSTMVILVSQIRAMKSE